MKVWDGQSFTYIATGFVRNNIMYDQRRLNDCLYLAQMDQKLGELAPHLKLSLKPHPFDNRENLNIITQILVERHQLTLINTPTRELTGAAIIDSPSTVLADLVLAGIPVFILNATCVLTPTFISLAHETQVLHSDPKSLINYLANTPLVDILHSQNQFREVFAERYLICQPPLSPPEAISSWIQLHQ